jgi:hypothetical protein
MRCDQVNAMLLNKFLMHGCKKDETKNAAAKD